ncbi:MAG TPA: hypothetical protein P5337_00045 [Aestuariivirga sp.]|nr:hypothetical protein [Alphaproteobacteria bacterium]HRX34760.1 hypothetical protein [Aestuariivirga sp.]
MHIGFDDARSTLIRTLNGRGLAPADDLAWATVWLEACGYPGTQMLAEALADDRHTLQLVRDLIGFDLQNVSCAFLAPGIVDDVRANGRVFLRNVRHGLFVLPFAVRENLAIGCPVDPSFAVGGERTKNPYAEKLAAAMDTGLIIDDASWRAVNTG